MENPGPTLGSGETALEGLMRHIPGFSGYLDREKRRDADRLQREFLARRVTELKGSLQNLQQDLLGAGNLQMVEMLDRLGNKLDRITERIRHASYGYAGFFDLVKVNEAELEQIYRFDLELLSQINAAQEALGALHMAVSSGGEGVAARLEDLRRRTDELDARLNERDQILKGVSGHA
jgi:hypothetical protein